jgi:hypothetical protein
MDHRLNGYIAGMSFVFVLILIAIVAFAGYRLVRHDARARPRSESHRPPQP